MVLKPEDYSDSFSDVDLNTQNLGIGKKNRFKALPDVNFAIKVADNFVKNLGLNFQVGHSLGDRVNCEDYLFLGEGWIGPGEDINIEDFIGVDVDQVLK